MVTIKQLKEQLDGSEILSIKYEGAIGIDGNKVIRGGKVIKTLKTKKDWMDIFNESYKDEFGVYPSQRKLKEMI